MYTYIWLFAEFESLVYFRHLWGGLGIYMPTCMAIHVVAVPTNGVWCFVITWWCKDYPNLLQMVLADMCVHPSTHPVIFYFSCLLSPHARMYQRTISPLTRLFPCTKYERELSTLAIHHTAWCCTLFNDPHSRSCATMFSVQTMLSPIAMMI